MKKLSRRPLLVAVAVAAVSLPTASHSPARAAGEQLGPAPAIAPPATLSTAGDFATDVLGNPWDFNDDNDVIPIDEVGGQSTSGISASNGMLTVGTQPGTTVRFVFNWPKVLPWGRDGLINPINASVYTQTTFRICADKADMSWAVRFENSAGERGTLPFTLPAGCSIQHFDLTYNGPVPGRNNQYPFPAETGPWRGSIVRFELFRGGPDGGQPIRVDWMRVHRADASRTPLTDVPVPVVLTPNREGGDDYATRVRGNPWDFSAADDIAGTHDMTAPTFTPDGMAATTVANDAFVQLNLGPKLDADRYHRLTIDACYGGGFSLSDTPGGGMNGRFAWIDRGRTDWTETQDFVVFPGCHRMTVDLVTDPASAVHDEATQLVTGWRGLEPSSLRFDVNEDRGSRPVTIREIKLADDAAFSSSYPITFTDSNNTAGNTVADVYVTANRGQFDGTLIAQGVRVQAGVNTFNWNGSSVTGAPLPNGTYWVYVTMRNGAKVGTGYSTGPVRKEVPGAGNPSYLIPVSPSRILDTRNGVGGNLLPLGPQGVTTLDVTGVGGVPELGVDAVVMNVTVDQPTAPGFLSVWPSGEPRPLVSSLNFVPGQVVPNLVTVKVGADGRVNIFNSAGDTDVVADVVGYYSAKGAGSGAFTALTPARIMDTREAGGPAAAGREVKLRVLGAGGVPSSGVSAVALNVTVDQATAPGFLTTWPSGEPRPTASTHNFVAGGTVANLVLAKVGAGGMVSMFNSAGSVQLVVDVVGYFSGSGSAFVPVTPRRVVDSREGQPFGSLAVGGTGVADMGVPAGASGVVVNVTATDSSERSFVTVWPAGEVRPFASTVNPVPGLSVPNHAYLKTAAGRLSVFNNSGSTDVVIDVFGYFRPG